VCTFLKDKKLGDLHIPERDKATSTPSERQKSITVTIGSNGSLPSASKDTIF